MAVIGTAYAVFALSLELQPARWGATPAYHNLLRILPQRGWGAVFAVTAVLLYAAVPRHGRRWQAVLALTAGFAVTTGWASAFVVRWLTSPNTTPETWVSWLLFDYLLLRAAVLLDYEEVRVPAVRTGRRDG